MQRDEKRHVPSLKGVLLSYSQIESLEPSARLMYDSPYSHIRIRAHFHTFSPEVGDVLGGFSCTIGTTETYFLIPTISDGIVNKVSPDHIGLLIYGVFNASIPSDQIRKSEFAWDSEGHTWMRRDDTQTPLEPGSIFRFTVKEYVLLL